MSDRVLVVGMAPGHGDPRYPLEGRIGRRLADLWGVSDASYQAGTIRLNLFDRDIPSGTWPKQEAAMLASRIKAQYFRPGLKVVLFGRRVADAFWCYTRPGEWWWHPRCISVHNVGVMILPHPSGVNRWWNRPSNVRKAQKALREHVPLARLPSDL